MSFDGDRMKGHQSQREDNRVKDEIAVEEQRLLEEDKLKDVKDGRGGIEVSQSTLQISHQRSQGPMVCWERFLHVRSLKVLLVEYDDSTRHIVSALLRNCSYEVIEVANGLQAWKILEDLTNHVDLVLTEVVLPCLSGISLLCKIMSHKIRRNVPVITMSSHDSMGLVFKCLSKGAVDFLVKPIRKNELKNLWQHVWRRCHSSSGSVSGSGSGSGMQTQKSIKSKSIEKSDNNIGSNDEEEKSSIDLKVGDESEDGVGSGTQSSWTKQAVEVDSSRPVCDHIHECSYSTCAQVVHSNADALDNILVSASARRECWEQKEPLDNIALCMNINTGMSVQLKTQHQHLNEVSTQLDDRRQNNLLEMGSGKFNERTNTRELDFGCETSSMKLNYESLTLTDAVTNSTTQRDSTEFEDPNIDNKLSGIRVINERDEVPCLELSLKRLRGVQDTGIAVQQDRNVLRRFGSSALSRYSAASNVNKAPSGYIGSSYPQELYDVKSQSSGNPCINSSNGANNNTDMGSTVDNAFRKSVAFVGSPAPPTAQNLHSYSAFCDIKNEVSQSPQQVMRENIDNASASILMAQLKGAHKENQIQHLHHHYKHHHVYHNASHNNLQWHLPDHGDMSLKKLAAAPQCGLSNVLGGPAEGNAGYCSINGSTSGSNYGSNGQNGSSTAINAGGTNIESDNGIAGNSESGDASGSGSRSGNRVDENKSAHREAALTKFRKKRRDRCFRKKVGNQSRKRLAEQRPRVRGQCVRPTASETPSSATDG